MFHDVNYVGLLLNDRSLSENDIIYRKLEVLLNKFRERGLLNLTNRKDFAGLITKTWYSYKHLNWTANINEQSLWDRMADLRMCYLVCSYVCHVKI